MALHERFDHKGNRYFVTDQELSDQRGCFVLMCVAVVLVVVLATPGFLVVRRLFPLMDGLPWFLSGITISGLLAVALLKGAGLKQGGFIYVALALGAGWFLYTVEPVKYRTYEAEQKGMNDARAGKQYEPTVKDSTRYHDIYSEAYKQGILARADKRVRGSDYVGYKTTKYTGEVIGFEFTKTTNRKILPEKIEYMYKGFYQVKLSSGDVRKVEFLEFSTKTD